MDEKALIACAGSSDMAYGYGTMLMAAKEVCLFLPLMQRVVDSLSLIMQRLGIVSAIALRETGNLAGALAALNQTLKINPQDSRCSLTIREIC